MKVYLLAYFIWFNLRYGVHGILFWFAHQYWHHHSWHHHSDVLPWLVFPWSCPPMINPNLFHSYLIPLPKNVYKIMPYLIWKVQSNCTSWVCPIIQTLYQWPVLYPYLFVCLTCLALTEREFRVDVTSLTTSSPLTTSLPLTTSSHILHSSLHSRCCCVSCVRNCVRLTTSLMRHRAVVRRRRTCHPSWTWTGK